MHTKFFPALVVALFFFRLAAPAQNDTSLPEITVNKEVEIIANRAHEKDPTTFQLISKKDLQKNNLGQDLPYLLDQTPSLVTTSDAGAGVGYTGMRIRGTDASRINVTINEVPINDAESQNVYWVNMPDIASSTADIQLQRGVGSSTNGAGAFGASVNLRTQTFSPVGFGEWSSSFGSFYTQKHTLKAGTGLLGKKFFLEGRCSYLSSNGYIERASANLWSYYVTAGYVHHHTSLRFIHFNGHEKTYQAWYGTPEDSLATNRRFNLAGTDYYQNEIPWHNQVDRYQQQYFQVPFVQIFPLGGKKMVRLGITPFLTLGSGYYEEYKANQGLKKYGIESTQTQADLVRRRWLDNQFYGSVFSLQYDNQNNWQITLGGMGAQYAGIHYGNVLWARNLVIEPNKVYYYSKSHKTDANVYLKSTYQPVRWLALFADLQYRYVQHSMKGNDNDQRQFDLNNRFHFFNPKAGLSLWLSHTHKLYASYARTSREPSRDDFIENKNNKAPLPEQLQDIELGYSYTGKSINIGGWQVQLPFQLNTYLMFYKNQLVVTGQLNDVGNPLRVNVPFSYRTGIEFCGKIIMTKQQERTRRTIASLLYALAYNRSQILHFNEYITTYDENYMPVDSLAQINSYRQTATAFSPEWIISAEPELWLLPQLSLAWNWKFISRQYLDNTESVARSLRPYWYSNIRVAYTLPLHADRSVTFTCLLNNIFNNIYEANGYTYRERYLSADGSISPIVHYNSYYPQAGFHFLMGVTMKL